MIKVTFLPEARRELTDATGYYERERPGLGLDFLSEIRHGIDLVSDHPEVGTPV
jgi:plasmid stabilization system protein ParE